MTGYRAALVMSAAFGIVGCPAAALAQAAPKAASDTMVQEVIVTANKRNESLQDIPLAVSALPSDTLVKQGADKFEDIALSAPSVSIQSNGSPEAKIVMRGITAGGFYEAQSPSTGYYLNDIPLSSTFTSGGTDLRLFDISRVEVLRGPQGTLYGAGAMGGAIRVITNEPDSREYHGQIEATGADVAGKAGQFDLNGMINIPLIKDQLALRAVGVYRDHPGYIDDPLQGRKNVNSSQIVGGRAALEWRPVDDLKVTLTGIYQHDKYKGWQAIDTDLNGHPIYGDLTQYTVVPEPQTATTSVGNLAIRYEMPWATLESSTSVARNVTDRTEDSTLAIGVLLPGAPGYPSLLLNRDRSFVQEVRLLSARITPLKWIVGAYYQNDDLTVYRQDRLDPTSLLGSLGLVPLDYHTRTLRKTYAVFGEATYDFTSKWQAILGLRYSHVPTQYDATISGLLLGIPDPANKIAPGPARAKSDDVSPKFELTYKPNSDILVYGEIAKGFRPGSPNSAIPGTPSTLLPDHLWDYEVGAKTAWLDHRLTVNAVAYYLKWSDIQVVANTPADSVPPVPPNIPYLGNIGSATSKGVELEVTATPMRGLTLSLAGAYTNATYNAGNASIGVVPGQRIPGVPRFGGAASADYEWDFNDRVSGFARIDARFETDKPNGLTQTDRGIFIPGYAVANVRVGANFGPDLTTTLFVDNIFDKRAATAMSTASICLTQTSCPVPLNPAVPAKLRQFIIDPRTVGVTISRRF